MMNPGRELDALVAQARIAGDPTRELDDFDGRPRIVVLDANGIRTAIERVPRYSTDIAAAWQLVEYLRDQWTVATEDMQLVDDFPRPFDDTSFFDTLRRNADRRWPWAFLYVTPHAICLAFLEGKGIDV